MRSVASCARRALTHPEQAAAACLRLLGDHPLAPALLDAALWRDADVAHFEERFGYAVRIEGAWGAFWLAPASTDPATLAPLAPVIPPRGLRALARAMVARLEEAAG